MAICLINGEFVATLSEAAGFKTGMALSKNQLIDLFPQDSGYKDILAMDDEATIRIHSSDIDELFMQVLYHLGNVDSPTPISSSVRLLHKYIKIPEIYPIYTKITELYLKHFDKMLNDAVKLKTKTLNPKEFLCECAMNYGKQGLEIASEIILGNIDDMHCRLSTYTRFEWSNSINLEDLFKSESLESQYGEFIDQRFINYLNRNHDKLGEIHWRKFEGLTAEYFDRQGYKVELGPGRNDGGIDVRVWKDNARDGDAPLILIQCKRYKEKIGQTVVKALWADVEWEKADSGLIVTTSSISPGAQQDCITRGYKFKQANKQIITQWLDTMKTPGTGVFMGK